MLQSPPLDAANLKTLPGGCAYPAGGTWAIATIFSRLGRAWQLR